MGYYTDFTVRIVEGAGDIGAVARAINLTSSYHVEVYDNTARIFEAKWYDCPTDMLAVSKEFPDLLLEVEGSGEQYPDIWAQRFRNGEATERVQAVLHFPGLGDVLTGRH